MEITRQQMVDAFNQWNTDYKANPERWTDPEDAGDDYGNKCADKLIEYIQAQNV